MSFNDDKTRPWSSDPASIAAFRVLAALDDMPPLPESWGAASPSESESDVPAVAYTRISRPTERPERPATNRGDGSVVGSRVGPYRVVRKLASGGMGTVYVGEHEVLGHKVALKFLHSRYADSEEAVTRFFREAVAATRIGHPGIVKVFDYGEYLDGQAYMAMEHLDGETLAARLRRGPMSVESILTFGTQIALTLAAAHDAGIVHRDLKPDNIFLVSDPLVPGAERVKVLDFGIAKFRGAMGNDVRTQAGRVIGTPHYMSPEQCRGAASEVDGRSDIYVLGCVLYHMATGRPPFDGNMGQVLRSHISAAPMPARASNTSISAALDELILRMLAKRAEDRPQSMSEVATELARVGMRVTANRLEVPRLAMGSGVDHQPIRVAPTVVQFRPQRVRAAGTPPPDFAQGTERVARLEASAVAGQDVPWYAQRGPWIVAGVVTTAVNVGVMIARLFG